MSHAGLSAAALAARLTADQPLCDTMLDLVVGDWSLRIRSNSEILLQRLTGYFAAVTTQVERPDMEMLAIDGDRVHLDQAFIDWRREPGKTGRKDSYVDLVDGRLVRKVRTGMLFLQSERHRIAVGPCLQYDNQVINFVNAQFMNRLQQHGWLICHASALVRDGAALAIAGLSGGGKSTLMMKLMDDAELAFLTNDRLFVKDDVSGVLAAGIPKLPRINPGTIVHNPRLQGLIPRAERDAYLAMPEERLWDIESKHDVFIEQIYGRGRIAHNARLATFIVLNWQRHDAQPIELAQVDVAHRPDLLAAIMKSPGPFYQYADGHFYADDTPLDRQAYLSVLADVPIYEVSGGVHFGALAERLDSLEWWHA